MSEIKTVAELNRRNKKSVEGVERYIKKGEYTKAIIELKFILDNGSEFEAEIKKLSVRRINSNWRDAITEVLGKDER